MIDKQIIIALNEVRNSLVEFQGLSPIYTAIVKLDRIIKELKKS